MADKKKPKGKLVRLARKVQEKVKAARVDQCWACSMNRCGQMFENTCSCCRSHPGR